METLWKILKIELPYNQAIPILGIYPKEYNSGDEKKYDVNTLNISTCSLIK
jgi:hypothetical protein